MLLWTGNPGGRVISGRSRVCKLNVKRNDLFSVGRMYPWHNVYETLPVTNGIFRVQIVRFKDKESHQIFLEPEGRTVPELYVQVLSGLILSKMFLSS